MQYGAAISGIGAYVPERRLTNEHLSTMVETNDEWIVTRTGIRERRIADPAHGTSHLATLAARHALTDARLEASALDLIIVATSTPDLTFPPTAALVQASLGATRAAAFDMNAVCSGFLQAYIMGAQFIQTGAYKHVLVIGAETLSRIVDYTDRSTCILFGDGAGAVVLSRSEAGTGLLDFSMHADGDAAKLVYCPRSDSPENTLEKLGAEAVPYIRQDGGAVFKLAVTGMTQAVNDVLSRNSLTAEQLDLLVPHQANLRIMRAVGKAVGVAPERVANCIESYGNTSAASIPLALHEAYREGRLKNGDLVMFTAFASGLLWGAAMLRWHKPAG